MWDPSTNGVVTTRDVIWMKMMHYTHPANAVFNVNSTPLDVDAKDVEDVVETNDGSDDEEVGKNNGGMQTSPRVRWAEAIASTATNKPEAGEAANQIALVTRSGRTVKQPEWLIEMMDVLVSAAEIPAGNC